MNNGTGDTSSLNEQHQGPRARAAELLRTARESRERAAQAARDERQAQLRARQEEVARMLGREPSPIETHEDGVHGAHQPAGGAELTEKCYGPAPLEETWSGSPEVVAPACFSHPESVAPDTLGSHASPLQVDTQEHTKDLTSPECVPKGSAQADTSVREESDSGPSLPPRDEKGRFISQDDAAQRQPNNPEHVTPQQLFERANGRGTETGAGSPPETRKVA